ncbi:hypothetical protein [Alicyclobacillus fastidiosus]|uniref:Uncharacterized protein n=1 Tax=Alicyclobacillus fastidiosus TaxID=392011 RepID=A0ABV5AA76_9BACL|nr:hypothetical protein [Alicyclobacillus fastidiosus]WEH07679.1 hypothetical protein PYS47_12945 [Alicyclobacillus fastidiosus]
MFVNGWKNNVVALLSHVCIAVVLSGIYIFDHFQWFVKNNFVTNMVVTSTVIGLLLYIFIGYVYLQSQRSSLEDFISVISAGVFGWVVATPILLEFHRVYLDVNVEDVLRLAWNFSDVMGIAWVMRVILGSTMTVQIASFTVASFIPSLLMWSGMFLKRKTTSGQDD